MIDAPHDPNDEAGLRGEDLELDARRLTDEQVEKRWLAAGRIVRAKDPEVFAQLFAQVEQHAAELVGALDAATDDDLEHRNALMRGEKPGN